jgi:mannose-6-phosphate isomerase-like protein (cupin superfamily)
LFPKEYTVIETVNLAQKFSLFNDQWSPKIVGELNDTEIKLAKVQGEFVWHQHENEDEMFLVVTGRLTIKLRDGEVVVNAGEFAIIPRGVEHMPVAEEEVQLMLIEPKSTAHTGSTISERTVAQYDKL